MPKYRVQWSGAIRDIDAANAEEAASLMVRSTSASISEAALRRMNDFPIEVVPEKTIQRFKFKGTRTVIYYDIEPLEPIQNAVQAEVEGE